MVMDAVFRKIDRYLKKENAGSLVVDVQNKADLETLVTHYQLPQNTFISASDADFCNRDEFPTIATLIDRLHREDKQFFVREVSSFYFLQGENALLQILKELLSMSIAGHVIIITWQCADQLKKIMKNDRRLDNRICLADGIPSARPRLVFAMKGVSFGNSAVSVCGIDRIAWAIEGELADTIYVETSKDKSNYPYSIYAISDMKDPYEVLCQKDKATSELEKCLGTEDDWQYALSEFQTYPSWERLVDAKVGNSNGLELVISNYEYHKSNHQWLWTYFIGLKLFGAGTDWCLNTASREAQSPEDFIRNIYRSILELSPQDPMFSDIYERRKVILKMIGNPGNELVDFCKIVLSKERDAIYYLTDNTIQERELVFRLLDKYGLDYDRKELFDILGTVYPDLQHYMEPFQFKNKLLDGYFQDYKYQKLVNKNLQDFMTVVEQQAVDRDYNTILQPRSSVIEGIDRTDAQAYFTDAMGVEYLGFIMAKCQELSLMAKVTVCRCELPSITCRNKEFWDLFSSEEHPIRTISDIDEIKHHGKYDYDYQKTKLPIHLIKELEIISNLLDKIWIDLSQDKYSKAILISDHGASRLAVIHGTENLLEMAENGNHSGRCCPKNEVDEKPESAVDADDFWVLANYDRFKGSRKANVEVHGGATLEEVTVPIIEITYLRGEVEVKIMPVNAPATFVGVPEIKVGFRKPAAFKIYASQKLMDVSIEIDGHNYPAEMTDDNFYVVKEMPGIRRAKLYHVDVFTCGNRIASGLPLQVKKEGMSEKSIL